MSGQYNNITPEDCQRAGRHVVTMFGMVAHFLVGMAAAVQEANARTIDIEAVSASPPALTTAELGVVKGKNSLPMESEEQPEQGEFWPSLR